jgi:Tol biopolymer transport system component
MSLPGRVAAVCLALTADAASVLWAQVNIARDPRPGETHLANLRQLTDEGTQAEAYFSRDGQWITFQGTRGDHPCDLQFVMRPDGTELRRVSPNGGKTTCGWFLPDGKRLFFGSTHAVSMACPPRPDPSKGYVWGLDPFDIYTANVDGTDLRRVTNYGVYTAEGVLSPDGRRIVFTSLKDGDLDIYTMNVDGTDVRRLTSTPGYDGGPWWSPDGKQIVYRAHHPANETELREYQDLLAQRAVRPSKVELWVMNADGSGQRQITHLGGANFGPSWTPDGKRIIFSSNHKNPRGGNFDLYIVALDGSGLTQITNDDGFDGFPMFSPDGKRLIWGASRHARGERDVNLFIADWRP